MLPQVLDPATLRSAAVVAVIVVVVLIVLALRFVQKVVLRVLIVAALVGLGAATWIQREQLTACGSTGACTFFGQEVQVPSRSSG